MSISRPNILPMALATLVLGCSAAPPSPAASRRPQALDAIVVRDTTVGGTVSTPATAAPWQVATVSTKLMGTVQRVHVQVGDRVANGAALVRLDVRDLDAKASQAAAGLSAAEASRAEAQLAVDRLRALVREEAAPRAQLDGAEAALARADGAVRTARGAAAELSAVRSYGRLHAPFAGIVVARHVDAGAFAAPGAPLLTVIDDHALRLSAAVAPAMAASLRAGMRVTAEIEGRRTDAMIDGVAPSPTGGTWTVTARVENTGRALATGGAATLHLPTNAVRGILIPSAALFRDGELQGVQVPSAVGAERRWLRVGRTLGTHTEILGGLRVGDTILVPRTPEPRT